MLNYVRRKHFRNPKTAVRAHAAALRKRRQRTYEAAVRDGHPTALEAERQRQRAQNPMGPANAMIAEIERLPRVARQARKVEYLRLLAECQAVDREAARARYLELRAQAIAEYEAFL